MSTSGAATPAFSRTPEKEAYEAIGRIHGTATWKDRAFDLMLTVVAVPFYLCYLLLRFVIKDISFDREKTLD